MSIAVMLLCTVPGEEKWVHLKDSREKELRIKVSRKEKILQYVKCFLCYPDSTLWAHMKLTDHQQHLLGRFPCCCWHRALRVLGTLLLVSPQPRVCVCARVRGILYISAIQVCFPLANEVIVVFPCTICLTERLLPTFSYAIVLGTSSIFHKRKFSILESSTARKHSASKVLCNTDHLLNRLLDG